jgi:hypothetical protein
MDITGVYWKVGVGEDCKAFPHDEKTSYEKRAYPNKLLKKWSVKRHAKREIGTEIGKDGRREGLQIIEDKIREKIVIDDDSDNSTLHHSVVITDGPGWDTSASEIMMFLLWNRSIDLTSTWSDGRWGSWFFCIFSNVNVLAAKRVEDNHQPSVRGLLPQTGTIGRAPSC